jgi:hypothetical protein
VAALNRARKERWIEALLPTVDAELAPVAADRALSKPTANPAACIRSATSITERASPNSFLCLSLFTTPGYPTDDVSRFRQSESQTTHRYVHGARFVRIRSSNSDSAVTSSPNTERR